MPFAPVNDTVERDKLGTKLFLQFAYQNVYALFCEWIECVGGVKAPG